MFKDRDPSKEFSNEKTIKIHEHIQDKTNLYGPRQSLLNNCSGYVMNSTLWDSTSWATERITHTDQDRTQYRKQFNQPKPFHNRIVKQSPGKLRHKNLTYEPRDMRVTGFGGKELDYQRFEETGRRFEDGFSINIDDKKK